MMGKDRSEGQGNGCLAPRKLRKAIYGLVNSENKITVDNPDDHDPASIFEAAREHLVGRVRAQANKHGWDEDQTSKVLHCVPQLVRFELPPSAITIETKEVKRGRGKRTEVYQTQRVKSRAEMPRIPVSVSLEPGFRDRLDQALTTVPRHQLTALSAASSAAAQPMA